MNKIFTIGHSTGTLEEFLRYLKLFKIDVLVDVRSVPYSRYAHQFNKEKLSIFIRKNGLYYIGMSETLGARYEEDECLFEDGQVDFSKIMNHDKFQEGIQRVKRGIAKGYRIALMCAEKNPLQCHRFSLISNVLHQEGYQVEHIVENNILSHQFLEEQLLEYYKQHHKITVDLSKLIAFRPLQRTLFECSNVNREEIYLALNKLIGYTPLESYDAMR